ncbi:MAG: helix-turn-helix transcriptional regulator [Bacteroidetes bacterium]|nr:helix-turn-helix transcriptional regulator [Bacteroidota bacterium]
MIVQFFFQEGKRIFFQEIERKKYKGILLPGGEIEQYNSRTVVITAQEWKHPLFALSHHLLETLTKVKLTISERSGLRFEAILSGELHISVNGEKRKLRAGEYHLTDVPVFSTLLRRDSSCSIFMTHYSEKLLQQLGIEIVPSPPQKMPNVMTNLINEILHNPYTEELRNFYYENSVRELLFFHLTQEKHYLPGRLINDDIEVIYKADSIIASNLQEHYTIEELSRMSGTNNLKLKKGFRQLFGMGVFHRLIFRRMEEAKSLLETTDKSIGEIGILIGYDTAAGFIHAFRRTFGLTPREWRILIRKDVKD